MNIKLLLTILLFSLVGSSAIAQESVSKVEPTIGVGRLQVSLNKDIPLYYSASSSQPFDTIKFSQVKEGLDAGKWTMSAKKLQRLVPAKFAAGDSYAAAAEHSSTLPELPVLVFKVVDIVSGGFVVVVNEQTYETCIIKQDKAHTFYTLGKPYWSTNHRSGEQDPGWFLYETWNVYLKRLAAIAISSPKIYDNPDGKLIASSSDRVAFKVIFAAGNWVKVRISGSSSNEVPEEGWVKWTDGVNLLVTPMEEIQR